ncbi:MAG: NF038129 family PEP-CTERM protein [Schlesneria sp.]
MRILPLVRTSLMAMSIVTSVLSPVAVHAGSIYYDVVIDTSSFAGQKGDVDFQLGGDANGVPITAVISNYSSSGNTVLDGSPVNQNPLGAPSVTVNGDLSSGPLTLYNDASAFQVADADQFVSQFGTSFEFRVTMTGDGIGNISDGTATLAISVFDSLGNPLFNGPDYTNNAAVFIQTTTDGSATFTQYGLSSVPEPSTLVSMLLGVLGIGVGIYRRRTTQAV